MSIHDGKPQQTCPNSHHSVQHHSTIMIRPASIYPISKPHRPRSYVINPSQPQKSQTNQILYKDTHFQSDMCQCRHRPIALSLCREKSFIGFDKLVPKGSTRYQFVIQWTVLKDVSFISSDRARASCRVAPDPNRHRPMRDAHQRPDQRHIPYSQLRLCNIFSHVNHRFCCSSSHLRRTAAPSLDRTVVGGAGAVSVYVCVCVSPALILALEFFLHCMQNKNGFVDDLIFVRSMIRMRLLRTICFHIHMHSQDDCSSFGRPSSPTIVGWQNAKMLC